MYCRTNYESPKCNQVVLRAPEIGQRKFIKKYCWAYSFKRSLEMLNHRILLPELIPNPIIYQSQGSEHLTIIRLLSCQIEEVIWFYNVSLGLVCHPLARIHHPFPPSQNSMLSGILGTWQSGDLQFSLRCEPRSSSLFFFSLWKNTVSWLLSDFHVRT